MIDVYAFATPNSVKVPILLEEVGLPYMLHGVNIRKGEQKLPGFLAKNPNGKVPVIIDHAVTPGPFVLTESAAILVYLAEKTGRLLPQSGPERARVFEHLFFHASGLSPAFGQAGYFQRLAPEPVPPMRCNGSPAKRCGLPACLTNISPTGSSWPGRN